MPPSSLMTELASSTLAALSIASTAVISPTRPMVSIRPRAFPFIDLGSRCLRMDSKRLTHDVHGMLQTQEGLQDRLRRAEE